MNLPSSELTDILSRCQFGIETILRREGSREGRAASLAGLLGELIPSAALTACLLGDKGASCLAVQSAAGPLDAGHYGVLRSQLMSIDPLASTVQTLPSAVAGACTLAAALLESGRSRGFLVIGLTGEAAPEEVARVGTLLTVFAPEVALRWTLETIRGDQAESESFALVGQAFLGLAHELNNALNSMMLQTSVVQLRVDQQARSELAAIRQHGAEAAGLLRSLQHVVQERRAKYSAVDLNLVVAEVLEEPELRQAVAARFAAEAPQVQGTRGSLKSLVRLMLQGVLASTKSPLQLQTEKRADGAMLSFEIAEPPADIGAEGASLPVDAVLWQNLNEVGRQAGQSLLRQLAGEIAVEPRSKGGLVLRITWG